MSHLGERVSALIDGELSHAERERALAHLTFCAECRAEVESMRMLKNRLRSLEPPVMPADLTMSLLRMAEPGDPLPPRVRPFPGRPVFGATGLPGMHGPGPLDNRPARGADGFGPGRPARHRRAAYVAVGMASAAMALGAMFLVNGAGSHPAPAPGEMFVPPVHRQSPFQRVQSTPAVLPSPSPSPSATPSPSR